MVYDTKRRTPVATVARFAQTRPPMYLVLALVFYPQCGNNPWGAPQYEWDLPSPPIEHNYPETPVITRDPYEYKGQEIVENAN